MAVRYAGTRCLKPPTACGSLILHEKKILPPLHPSSCYRCAASCCRARWRSQRPPRRDPISSSFSPMTWATPTSALTDRRTSRRPVLNKMAAEGMLFTDAYSGSPLCAPCRSTLFTGLHTGHTPIRHNPSAARGWNRTTQGDPPLARRHPHLRQSLQAGRLCHRLHWKVWHGLPRQGQLA